MLIAMEITFAKENKGCVCGGHMVGCCGVFGDMEKLSLVGLEVSFRGLGELGVGDETEENVGLLATRVSEWWIPAGLGEPGDPGYGNGK